MPWLKIIVFTCRKPGLCQVPLKTPIPESRIILSLLFICVVPLPQHVNRKCWTNVFRYLVPSWNGTGWHCIQRELLDNWCQEWCMFWFVIHFLKKLKPLNSLHLHQNFWTYVVHSLIQYRLCSGKPPLEKKYVTKMLFVSNEYEMW